MAVFLIYFEFREYYSIYWNNNLFQIFLILKPNYVLKITGII